jgi:hypothetical protein
MLEQDSVRHVMGQLTGELCGALLFGLILGGLQRLCGYFPILRDGGKPIIHRCEECAIFIEPDVCRREV